MSTPVERMASFNAVMVEKRGSIMPFSIRVMDCFDTPARSANSSCDQFSRPRAALILAA
jgi:hypothetical protein